MPNNLIVEGGTKYICGKGHCMKGAGHCMGGNIMVGGTIQDFLNNFIVSFLNFYEEQIERIMAIRDQVELDNEVTQLYTEAQVVFRPIYAYIRQRGLQTYSNNIGRNRNSFINVVQNFVKALLRSDVIKKRPKSLRGSKMGDKGYQLIGDILANTTDLNSKVERVYQNQREQINQRYANNPILLNELKFLLYYLKLKFQNRGFIRESLQFDRMEGIEEEDEEDEEDDEEEQEEEPQQTSMVGGNINDYNLNIVFDNEFNVDNINNYQLRDLFEDTLDTRFNDFLLSQGYTDDTSPGLSLLVYRIITLYILDYLGWGDMSEQERDEFDLVSIFESYRPVSTNSIINDLRTFILRLPQEPQQTNSGLLANAETFLRDPNTGEITTFNDSSIFIYMVGTLILALRRVMPGSQYFMPSVN